MLYSQHFNDGLRGTMILELKQHKKFMRQSKIFFAFFILLINCQSSLSQDKNENLVLFDSVSEMNSEDLSARLDLLAYELIEAPNSLGYIVMYGSANPIKNAFYRYAITRYFNFRNFNKLSFITTTESNKSGFEFWISKDGTKPKVNAENFSLTLPSNRAVVFVEDSIEIVNIEGKQTYLIAGCEVGCIETLSFHLLSDFLNANPQINAYIIVHAGSLKKAKRVKSILAREAFEEEKISSNRLNFLFGGKNKSMDNGFSEIEVYLASNASQLPKSTSTKYRPL
jgi:hypothetical protein